MEQSVHIYRPLINHEELVDHYQRQDIMKRIVRPVDLRISLAHTMRQFSKSTLENMLDNEYYVFPNERQDSDNSRVSHGSRKHVTFGMNRVLSLELTSPKLSLRQLNLHRQKITFFELEDFRPHVVLDFNLDPEIDISSLEPFSGKLYFDGEVLTEAFSDIRKNVKYKKL